MKMFLQIIGLIFLVLIVVMGGFVAWAFSYHKKLKAEPVKTVDLSKVKDGKYEGAWDAKMWTMPVEVTVKDHKMTDLKIVRENFKVPGNIQEYMDRIVKEQTVEVDAIAGATITTKTIRKSIELALEKGV